MLFFIQKLFTLFRKEMLMIVKDKRSRITLIMPIIVQTLLFGYVASFDLNRVDYAWLDEDNSFASRELAAAFEGSTVFRRVEVLSNSSEISRVLDNRQAILVIHIGPHFARNLNLGQKAQVQALADGRNSNVAGIALSYVETIVAGFNREHGQIMGINAPNLTISNRAWFNPNLETRWNILSGMVAVLAIIQVLFLSGQSVAREKEQGTFDQLLVTPFTPAIIMLGKALPPVLVGLVQSSLILLIALWWFNIPFAGSYPLLYLGLIIFNVALVGIGLCISMLVETMQQATLFNFSLVMPMILLSGFVTPINSMPEALQVATLINPARYGVEFSQRIYLEGAGFNEMIMLYLPLLVIGAVTMAITAFIFRQRMGRASS